MEQVCETVTLAVTFLLPRRQWYLAVSACRAQVPLVCVPPALQQCHYLTLAHLPLAPTANTSHHYLCQVNKVNGFSSDCVYVCLCAMCME